MLSRLETTYLGILRVMILIAATIALLVAIGAFVSALPALMRQVGVSHDDPTKGGTLGEYIDQRKATVSQNTAGGSSVPTVTGKRDIDPNLSATANNVADYLAKGTGAGTVSVPMLEDSIIASSADIPLGDKADYYTDIKRLSEQLKISTGKRLTADQVSDLFSWHEHRFVANLSEKSAERITAAGTSLLKLTVAGYSFAGFILVVFTFLFVKIERSLRVVRVKDVDHA